MRIYLGVGEQSLSALAAGAVIEDDRVAAESEDEADELDAMLTAAEDGPVVVSADVERADDPVGLAQVAALHLDIDGTGQLAWFAPQELPQVLERLRE